MIHNKHVKVKKHRDKKKIQGEKYKIKNIDRGNTETDMN